MQAIIGNTFTIITGTSVTGIFATLNGLDIGNGKKSQVNYNATDGTLEVAAAELE